MPPKNTENSTNPVAPGRPRAGQPFGAEGTAPALLVASGVVGLMTIVGVLLVLSFLVSRPEQERLAALEIFGLMAAFVGGLSLALGLLVMALLLSYARTINAALQRMAQSKESRDEDGVRSSDEFLLILRELRDNSLLSDEQKEVKLQRQASEQRRALHDGARSFQAKGEFHRALSLVSEMERRFGPDGETERWRKDIQTARESAEKADVEDATRKIEELIAISAWPRADELVNELLDRHPDSIAARKLANHVARQRQRHEDEQRLNAYAEIQRFTSRREWSHALGAARSFLEKFPKSLEAEALKVQIETLEANAEIEERQQIELQIRGLIQQENYARALELSRDVIRRYPNSPQAEALREQLPRLEARSQSATTSV